MMKSVGLAAAVLAAFQLPAVTATANAAATPDCSVPDGSDYSDSYPCTCGNTICSTRSEKCKDGTCTPDCSVTDGIGYSASYPCTCGNTICSTPDEKCKDGTCSASDTSTPAEVLIATADSASDKIARLKQKAQAKTTTAAFRVTLKDGQGEISARVTKTGQQQGLAKADQEAILYNVLPDGAMSKLGYTNFFAIERGLVFTHSDGHALNCDAKSGAAVGDTAVDLGFACAKGEATSPRFSKKKMRMMKDPAYAYTSYGHYDYDNHPDMFWHGCCDGHVPYCYGSAYSYWSDFDYPYYAVGPYGYYGCSTLTGDYCDEANTHYHTWVNDCPGCDSTLWVPAGTLSGNSTGAATGAAAPVPSASTGPAAAPVPSADKASTGF